MVDEKIYLGGLPVGLEPYETFKYQIKTGDALVWHGHTIIQRGIELWMPQSGNTIGLSHASLCYAPDEYQQWRERRFVIEATGKGGLHPALISDTLFKHGRCFHISTGLNATQRARLEEWAFIQACSGIPYDWGGCWSNLFKNNVAIIGAYYCSEFLTEAWNYVQYTALKSAMRPNDVPVYAPRPCRITELFMRPENG